MVALSDEVAPLCSVVGIWCCRERKKVRFRLPDPDVIATGDGGTRPVRVLQREFYRLVSGGCVLMVHCLSVRALTVSKCPVPGGRGASGRADELEIRGPGADPGIGRDSWSGTDPASAKMNGVRRTPYTPVLRPESVRSRRRALDLPADIPLAVGVSTGDIGPAPATL